ncbi:hypothetical protein [Lentzea kentuckyensis]|uniref:hypothetical protein n=1 Tax=Lentzea kentuckyensis TaxID=360086 RepID=UPI00117B193A|nr:hypothetical protein [Lentzea kentuckyensis]
MRFVLAICLAALTACAAAPAVQPVTSAPATTTSTASTPDLVRALEPKVKAALMAPAAFDDFGMKPLLDRPALSAEVGNTDGYLSEVCLGARVDAGVSTSRKRVWKGLMAVEQDVFALIGVTGAHVLETVRTKARSCQTYVAVINKPARTVEADVELPELPGVDGSYAFCQSVPDLREGHWICEAVLVRGDMVMTLAVNAGEEASTRKFCPWCCHAPSRA